MKIVKALELTDEEFLCLRKLLGKLSTNIVLELGLSKYADRILEKIYNEMTDLEDKYLEV